MLIGRHEFGAQALARDAPRLAPVFSNGHTAAGDRHGEAVGIARIDTDSVERGIDGAAAEPALAPWFDTHGALPPITPQPFDPVDALARAICHQQLSGKAAATIIGRLEARVGSVRLDPQAFAGGDSFLAQMDFIGDACRASQPVHPDGMVRLPGDQASSNILRAQQQGIALSQATLANLAACAKQLGVEPLAL